MTSTHSKYFETPPLELWNPTMWTPPLNAKFPSHGEWLLPLVDMVWGNAGDKSIILDEWQRFLIYAVLEVYPDGHERAGQLRWRQAIISMARQNGKSVLGAIFGLYGLIRSGGSQVIGVASSADQARILYERTLYVINSHPSLKKRFHKLTETRGIKSKDGSKYEIKAAKGEALQGLPIDVGLIDELHIVAPSLYRSLVDGTGGRINGLIIGITTAGDDDSELLKQLYQYGEQAAAGNPQYSRFGFWKWEAPEASVPKDDETLAKYLLAANPGLACGRLDMENVIADCRVTPEIDVIRYRLNRFVAATNTFIDIAAWNACKMHPDDKMPNQTPLIISIDRTPGWEYATFVAATKNQETGDTYTEVIASIVKPTIEQLLRIALELRKKKPARYVMDNYQLRDLATELKRKGLQVTPFSQTDVVNASAMFHSKIIQNKIKHPADELLSRQIPHVIRKNIGTNFRISRKDSISDIDAVLATAFAIYQAEIEKSIPFQVMHI